MSSRATSSAGGAALRCAPTSSSTLWIRLCLGLVERRAREPAGLGGFADWSLVDVDQSQHLVLDLQQVVGIEELAAREQGVRDAGRTRVQRGVLPQDLLLVVLGSIYRHM